MSPVHRFPVRIYYEDTDFSGLVYHASYLRFFERGRSEFLRAIGVDQLALFSNDPPLVFAVRRMEIDYISPARMDDLVTIETRLEALGGASMTLRQSLVRGEERLTEALVIIVCISGKRAARIPPSVRAAIDAWQTSQPSA